MVLAYYRENPFVGKFGFDKVKQANRCKNWIILILRPGGSYKVLKNLLKHKLLHHDSSEEYSSNSCKIRRWFLNQSLLLSLVFLNMVSFAVILMNLTLCYAFKSLKVTVTYSCTRMLLKFLWQSTSLPEFWTIVGR